MIFNRTPLTPQHTSSSYISLHCRSKFHLSRIHYSLAIEKLLTYCLQKADVFSQGAHTATEGDDEHEDPHDHQHHRRVHWQTCQSCLWEEGKTGFKDWFGKSKTLFSFVAFLFLYWNLNNTDLDAVSPVFPVFCLKKKTFSQSHTKHEKRLCVLSVQDRLPACLIRRAYTPIATITREIIWGQHGEKTFLYT